MAASATSAAVGAARSCGSRIYVRAVTATATASPVRCVERGVTSTGAAKASVYPSTSATSRSAGRPWVSRTHSTCPAASASRSVAASITTIAR